jgi:hypothetical protein
MIEVQGMNHAQFGSYGSQSGDNSSDISDTTALKEILKVTHDFFSNAK